MLDVRFPLEISPEGNLVFDRTEVELKLSLIKAICYTIRGEHPVETTLGLPESVFQSVTPSELISSVEAALKDFVDPPFEVFASVSEGMVEITILYDGETTVISYYT